MFEKEPKIESKIDHGLYHAMQINEILSKLKSDPNGLSTKAVNARLQQHGSNEITQCSVAGLNGAILRQLKSPMIYVLFIAVVFSMISGKFHDALFIGIVLMINALIGALQEFYAMHSQSGITESLDTKINVMRDGEVNEVEESWLVPGDIVLLESGSSVPADMRLITSTDLEIDQSRLTGQHKPILKNATMLCDKDSDITEHFNMAYRGALVTRGSAKGVVVTTGIKTHLGEISAQLASNPPPKAPLLEKIEHFTNSVAIMVAIATVFMAIVASYHGMGISEIILLAIALAVSAIPEGLPIVLIGVLTVSMRRMEKYGIIVRNMFAAESLGSCTHILTEKNGALTQNKLSANRVVLFPDDEFEVTGVGKKLKGEIKGIDCEVTAEAKQRLHQLSRIAILANEGFLIAKEDGWSLKGNPLDTAMLVLAHKVGIEKESLNQEYVQVGFIPFESSRQYSASLNKHNGNQSAYVKGAVEQIMPMCSKMATPNGDIPIVTNTIETIAEYLASKGYRVIALAQGDVSESKREFTKHDLKELTLVGLVGAVDPIRTDAVRAIKACKSAGVETIVMSGDNPVRGLAIAKELELTDNPDHIISGEQLSQADIKDVAAPLINRAKTFVRVNATQKLDIIDVLEEENAHVAFIGAKAHDAYALSHAPVGLTLNKTGTDIAKENADLIIAKDNFATILAGIKQGRIAQNNIRKIFYLLVSTGLAEILLFSLALISGLPIPLLPVQLLWLNLVTNGIQDVALAFEPAEGGEMRKKPRSPDAPILDRLMIERVVISALWMGFLSFYVFSFLLDASFTVEEARGLTLLLMVLFENIDVFNSRSETRSIFKHNLLLNPFLLFGTLAAQGLHQLAMYTPWLRNVLQIHPVSFDYWIKLFVIALSCIVIIEAHKYLRKLLRH